MKIKKLLLAAVLATAVAACSDHATAPDLRAPAGPRMDTSTPPPTTTAATTTSEPDTTSRQSGVVGPSGGK